MGDLSTPNSVQKLQTALHAKAKAEPGYRFYALYDKISREDILAHAYAQCRSNKGAPGVDRQDFEAVEAYGVERWLGELALALRQETYRPDPIRRVFIPKANGKLRPEGEFDFLGYTFGRMLRETEAPQPSHWPVGVLLGASGLATCARRAALAVRKGSWTNLQLIQVNVLISLTA